MSTQTLVASWTITLIRGGVFGSPLEFRDQSGTPIPYTSPEIVITPNGASPVTWSIGGGQITFVSTGTYSVFIPAVQINSYLWSSGKYRLQVIDGSSNTVPCLIEGLIFVKDC